MKKKLLVGLLAVVMCFALVGCGKTENGGSTNNGGSESKATLNDSTKDNYASLLKEYFGLDVKDFEESGFEITKVYGGEFTKSMELKLTYNTKLGDDFASQDAYKEKLFNATKTLGDGSNYECDKEGKITSESYTDFSAHKNAASDYNTWYYKWNGKEVKVYVVASSYVEIDFSSYK